MDIRLGEEMQGTKILDATYCVDEVKHITKRTDKLMDEILDLLAQIDAPEDSMRKLWLTTTRESFHDYLKHAEEDDPIKTEEQFLDAYPHKKIWIPLYGYRYEKVKYLRINSLSLEIDEAESNFNYFESDYYKVLKWVKDAVIISLNKVRAGTYNDEVKNELPYTFRYGTIKRNIYWAIHPHDKTKWMEDLTQEECEDFLANAKKYEKVPDNVIKGMTFRKYFDMAIACYKKIGLEIYEDDLKTFFAYADDFGGRVLENEVDYDSAQNFDDFVDDRCGNMGGHPFGIIRGSSRTRIMLYPEHKDGGYYFLLNGNPNWNVRDLVRCFIALRDMDVPMQISSPEETIKYLQQEDRIGFVSIERLPIYCHLSFPDMHIEDFRHFNPKTDMKLIDKIEWLPIGEVKLKQ